jgi:poly(3-hydroxybutyrate) depolymerase
VPESYQGDQAVPLVLDFHGFAAGNISQLIFSGLLKKSNEKNFIIAWPQGYGTPALFNGEFCCDWNGTGGDDLRFVRQLVEEIKQAGNINHQRIYASGLSNGGAFSHYLGCVAADIFAAVAPVSFLMGEGYLCQPSEPISIINLVTPTDSLVPNGGGYFGFPTAMEATVDIIKEYSPNEFWPRSASMQRSYRSWADANQCSRKQKIMFHQGDNYCKKLTDCAGDAEVTLCEINAAGEPLGGHVLYFNNDKIDVADLIWEFFAAHPKSA